LQSSHTYTHLLTTLFGVDLLSFAGRSSTSSALLLSPLFRDTNLCSSITTSTVLCFHSFIRAFTRSLSFTRLHCLVLLSSLFGNSLPPFHYLIRSTRQHVASLPPSFRRLDNRLSLSNAVPCLTNLDRFDCVSIAFDYRSQLIPSTCFVMNRSQLQPQLTCDLFAVACRRLTATDFLTCPGAPAPKESRFVSSLTRLGSAFGVPLIWPTCSLSSVVLPTC
jgi:hypothetical protein